MADAIKLHRHPDYVAMEREFRTYRDTYEGKHDVMTRPEYLWEFESETVGDEDAQINRALREQRSQYTNFIEPTTSRWESIFLKEPPDISKVERAFKNDEMKNVDGEGKGLVTFIKEKVL